MKIIKPALALCLAIGASAAFSSEATATTCSSVASQLAQQAYNNCMASREDTMINRGRCGAEKKAKQIFHNRVCSSALVAHKARNTRAQFCATMLYQGYLVNC